MTMRTHIDRALTAGLTAAMLCAAVSVAAPERAHAQEVQVTGPLAGAPAVHHQRLWRKGRLQLQPFFGVTLQNEFSRGLFVGAQLKYHLTDWLGIGVWGAYGVASLQTRLTKEIKKKGITSNDNRLSLPSRADFGKQIGELNWMAGADLSFIPLRGKISLFQKIFVDTDLQIFGGVAFVGLDERANTTAGVCDDSEPAYDATACLDTQTARSSRIALAPSFGVGLNMHFKEFMGLSIQWRGIPFKWNTSGTDEGGNGGSFPDGVISSKDRIGKFNHMFSVGFVFYIPPGIKVSD